MKGPFLGRGRDRSYPEVSITRLAHPAYHGQGSFELSEAIRDYMLPGEFGDSLRLEAVYVFCYNHGAAAEDELAVDELAHRVSERVWWSASVGSALLWPATPSPVIPRLERAPS
jgi:hypothetical protein